MAIIYSYPLKSNPSGGDFLVITDSDQDAPDKNRTKSLTLGGLASYVVSSTSGITGGGTLNTIAMFTPDGQKISDSIITQASSGVGVTITGSANITDDLAVVGNVQASTLDVSNISEFLGTASFGGDIAVLSRFLDKDGNTGTAGQLLSSTGNGVAWVSDEGGTVTGTGINNTLPIWTDGPNGVLGDSVITQDPGNSVEITTGSPTGSNCDYRFGVETFSGQKVGTAEGFEFKTGGLSGGYYKSGGFRFEAKLAVGRDSNPSGATLDVGKPTDISPAAYFRNGVVLSNNPSGVQVDNTSMVIGGGNNDIVSGSDSCLAVGNNNQILSDSDNSLVVGQGNTIKNNSDNCFAIGQSNTIDGANTGTNSVRSQVLGFDNSLSNSYSSFIAGGDNTVTTGNNAFALGYSHTLEGEDSQFAFGENCTGPASGQNTFMMGSALTGSNKSMAVGFRNDTSSYPAIDYPNGLGETKFVVGVGSNSNSNAIIITEGGVNRGNPNVEQIPRIILPQQETLEFASDTDATAGGIPTGGLYRNGNDLKINFNETAAPGNEGLTILTPYFQIATPGGSDTYTQLNNIVDFDWSGGSGTYEYILPSATAIPYRKIRFVNNSTITASTKVHITAPTGETIDGGAFYEINKAYNGCAVWSDGVQWIVIQAKAS